MLKTDGERRCIRPIMYEMLHGSRPHSSMIMRPQIWMRCGTEACVNPDHITVATDEDRLLTQIKQEVYLWGRVKAQADPHFRFLLTPAYIEAEARRQLNARLADAAPPGPQTQAILDQIQRRAGVQPEDSPCEPGATPLQGVGLDAVEIEDVSSTIVMQDSEGPSVAAPRRHGADAGLFSN